MKTLLESSYFEKSYEEYNPKKNKWVTVSAKKPGGYGGTEPQTGRDRYKDIAGINNAFFGRNYQVNRAWTPHEKRLKVGDIDKYSSEEINTATLKFANTLRNVDMNISLFDRIN